MNTKNNQRAQNTRAKIESVFLELLQAKEISKITVQDICRKSSVNRSTFYAHYTDIYDLFEQMEKSMSEHIADILYDEEKGGLRPFGMRRYVELFEYIKENENFYRVYLNDIGRIHSINFHVTGYGQRVMDAAHLESTETQRKMLDYVVEYFGAALNAIIRHWLNTGCVETPQELGEILANINNGAYVPL